MKSSSRSSRLKTVPVGEVTLTRSWVFYGRSASGKTTLAATFPKPLLLVDAQDEGTDSISDVDGVHVYSPNTWDELDEVYWSLKENAQGFKTVVIDTITSVQNLLIREVCKPKGSKAPGDWGTMTKAQWGEVSSRIKEWITNLRSLPMDVIFIAQDRVFNLDEEDSMEGVVDPEVGPNLSPATMRHLCSAVTVIGNTFLREKVTIDKKTKKRRTSQEYSIRLGPNAYYITKIRKPLSIEVPAFLDNPTFEDLLDIIKGK